MKILIIDTNSLGKEDIEAAFVSLGHSICHFAHADYDLRISDVFCTSLSLAIDNQSPDMVFSSNYYPLVATVCHDKNIPYAAWVYDCPQTALFSATVIHKTNYIFLFDSEMYTELHNAGIETVHFLPLSASATRMDTMIPTPAIREKLNSEVAFVGSMYNEEHNLFDRFDKLSLFSKGYLDGIMAAQSKIYGCSFIEKLLQGKVLDEIREKVPYKPDFLGTERDTYVYASYFIERKLTQLERKDLISAVSDNFTTKLYTHLPTPYIPNAINMGSLDSYSEAPYVFKCSKINLNISLRSIHTGIPLRDFEIMGAKGFLMSNYQSDFENYFEANKDYVYYEDKNDLIDKCRFYLSHDNERLAIAHNGYNKIKADHSYEVRIKAILDTVF